MDLYWIDLETTGLNPVVNGMLHDRILEIAVYKANLKDPFTLNFVYQNVIGFNNEIELDDFVKNMHTKNGLLEECFRSTTTISDIEDDLVQLIPKPLDRKNMPVFAGSAIHFDAGFIKSYMPTIYSYFSHRHYDVSSLKLFCQSLGMPEFKKAEAHRAKDDIIESVEHAKDCVEWLKKNLK